MSNLDWHTIIFYGIFGIVILANVAIIVLWKERAEEAGHRYRRLHGIPECDNCQDLGRVASEVPGRVGGLLISYCPKGCEACKKAFEQTLAVQQGVFS